MPSSREAGVFVGYLFGMLLAFGHSGESPERVDEIRVEGRRMGVRPAPGARDRSGPTLAVEPGVRTLREVLALQPMVDVESTGTEPLIRFRGQEPYENRYFLEGVPLSEGEFQSASLQRLPLEGVDRLEVFPAGLPVRFGSDGVAGALNFGLRQTGGELAGDWGSFDEARLGAFASSGALTLAVRARRSDGDYLFFDDNGTPLNSSDDSQGVRSNNHSRSLSVLPTWRWSRGSHRLKLFSLVGWGERGLQGIPQSGARWREMGHATAAIWEVGPAGANQTRVRLWAKQSLQQTQWNGQGGESPFRLSRLGQRSFGGRIEKDVQVGERSQLTWVGALEQESGSPEGVLLTADRGRWQGALGLGAHFPLGDWVLAPGLLGVGARYAGGGGEGAMSPRLGWEVRWGRLRWEGTLGQWVRLPSLAERLGSPSGWSPNPGLKAERNLSAETGLRFETPGGGWLRRWGVGATVAVADSRDRVVVVAASPWTRVATNVGRARVFSQELLWEGVWDGGWTTGFSVAALQSQNRSEVAYWRGRELPYRPRLRAQGRVGWDWGRWGLRYENQWWGGVFEDLANLRWRRGVWVHSVGLRRQTDWGEWSVTGENLGDVMTTAGWYGGAAVTTSALGMEGYPAPGRRLVISGRLNL